MKSLSKQLLIIFALTTVLGACMHFLYSIFPNPVTALISPVNESLWEHLKILFWPYLAALLYLTRGGERGCRAPWLLSLLIISALMLLLGYLYHVVMGGEQMLVDIGIYVLVMTLGFLLPGLLHGVADKPFLGDLAIVGAVALAVAILLFTFLPPDHILFIDLSGANTFARIPC